VLPRPEGDATKKLKEGEGWPSDINPSHTEGNSDLILKGKKAP